MQKNLEEAEENGKLEDILLDDETLKKIKEQNASSKTDKYEKIENIKAFGLNDNLNREWRFSYYIGLDYLDDENQIPLYVHPKYENLNYLEMLQVCLECPDTAKYVTNIYEVRDKKPLIQPPNNTSHSAFMLFIMYHYLTLLSEIVKRPLVKSYVGKTENLKSKIKGKILLNEHIVKNIANMRYDRIMCSFDEYSEDCPANRLLHSAYKICKDYGKRIKTETYPFSKYDRLESRFQHIGYIKSPTEINKIKTNPLFLEYKTALRLAKLIYALKTKKENMQARDDFFKIYPYIINMAILFELYVYSCLKKSGLRIGYQISGVKKTRVDFLDYDNKIIIDTKYKDAYDPEIDDIRQVSGYARDIGILKKLFGEQVTHEDSTVPNCLIIYPDMDKNKVSGNIEKDKLLDDRIEEFNRFFRYCIGLPKSD